MAGLELTVIRLPGLVPYVSMWERQRELAAARGRGEVGDLLLLLEHEHVYTNGRGGKREHLLVDEATLARLGAAYHPIDRGGDITYHGPGQAVLYTLVDLARRSIKVKRFVWLLEQAVIDLLGGRAERKAGAPGVYVDGAKIAALGIRVVRGRAYHGLALNVDMDLAPFGAIDPCGYPGLRVTQMRDLGFTQTPQAAAARVSDILIEKLDA